MKKILVMLMLTASFLAAINVQDASKKELMCIKGIGDKKANAVIIYRKSNILKSPDDLLEIKGFGKALVRNVKNDIMSKACGAKTSTKKADKKKIVKKEEIEKEEKSSDDE